MLGQTIASELYCLELINRMGIVFHNENATPQTYLMSRLKNLESLVGKR